MPAANLSLTYLVLAIPGGSAVEKQLDAPAGTAHLLEHLLYAQNSLHRSPMDQYGGKFGLLTDRETITALLVFSPADASLAWQHIKHWWDNPVISADLLAREKDIVMDEINRAVGGPIQKTRARSLAELSPHSHFSRDFSGLDQRLMAIDVETMYEWHRKIRLLGASVAAVGPVCPWEENTECQSNRLWRPESPRVPVKDNRRIRLAAAGLNQTLVYGLSMHAGLASDNVLGSFAAYGALAYGRIHPVQKRFHEQMRLRFLDAGLESLPSANLFSVSALVSESQGEEVANLVSTLLHNPEKASTPERLHKVLLYELAKSLDCPKTHARQLAISALCGHPSPLDLYNKAKSATHSQLNGWVQSATRSSSVTCTLKPSAVPERLA